MVIFHSYISLPEGRLEIVSTVGEGLLSRQEHLGHVADPEIEMATNWPNFTQVVSHP